MVEPLELEQQGFALEVIPAYEWGYRVYGQVLATTERLLATEPGSLIRFLPVTFDGWRRALQTPDEVGRIIAAHYLPEADPALQRQMLMAMQPCLEGDLGREKLGWMEAARWAQSIEYLLSQGVIAQPLHPHEVMTPHLIEAVYRT